MKFKTKLIPLASVAAVCATVAPITITSCGNNTNGFTDIRTKFMPTIDYYTGRSEFISDDEATEIYADHASRNPEIFVQDYLWSSSTNISEIQDDQRDLTDDLPLGSGLLPDGGVLLDNLGDLDYPALQSASNDDLADAQNALDAAVGAAASAAADAQAAHPYTSSDFFGLSDFHDIKIHDVTIKPVSLGDFRYAMTVSLKMEYQYQYKYTENILERSRSLVAGASGHKPVAPSEMLMQTLVGELEIKNLPFLVTYDGSIDKGFWYVQPYQSVAFGHWSAYNIEKNPWTIHLSENSSNTYSEFLSDYTDGDVTYTTTNSYVYDISSNDADFTTDSWKWDAARFFMEEYVFCRSHYFYLIPKTHI